LAKKKSKGSRGDKPGHPFRGNQWTKSARGTKSKVFGKTETGRVVTVTQMKGGRYKTQAKGLSPSYNTGRGAARRAIGLAKLQTGASILDMKGKSVRATPANVKKINKQLSNVAAGKTSGGRPRSAWRTKLAAKVAKKKATGSRRPAILIGATKSKGGGGRGAGMGAGYGGRRRPAGKKSSSYRGPLSKAAKRSKLAPKIKTRYQKKDYLAGLPKRKG
jgi:hypothetical protein